MSAGPRRRLDIPAAPAILPTYRSVGFWPSGPCGVSAQTARILDLGDSAESPPPPSRRREILETAARLICAQGYDATSIQAVADACGLTKAGLYHYIGSKEHLLVEIMNYGMDVFEEQVLSRVAPIADPLERLQPLHGAQRAAGHPGAEQGGDHHPPRARHPDRRGAGADQRPQEALRALPRSRVRRGGRRRPRSARSTRRWRRSRSSAWCCGSTSGSAPDGGVGERSSRARCGTCSSAAWRRSRRPRGGQAATPTTGAGARSGGRSDEIATPVGIAGWGAYVPRYRVSTAAISAAWRPRGRGGPGGGREVGGRARTRTW